ncbi:MAG: amidohydrolase family protein [Bacteroidales bacterium]|nr:amidohydrolase family protein [Bacteroidales bacterium]
MNILLKNATYINWQSLNFKKCNIVVNGGVNGKIKMLDNTDKTINESDFEIIDCSGKLVSKSFACGHHHVYSALAKGMNAPKKIPGNFYEILKYVWWTLDKCLTQEMIEYSALTTAIACAKNGITFVIDHHASPNFVKDSLDTIARAFEKVGVSHLLCYEISDRDGKKIAEQGLEETKSFLQNNQGLVGLHASFTVDNNTLKKAVKLSADTNSGIHIHVAEDIYDQDNCLNNYNLRVVERLNNFGVLDFSKTILGHCLYLNENEKELIKNSKSWIVQNTESNLNNNVGYFNSCGLGEKIMLGTDGMHSDMLRSAKAAFFVGQGFDTIDYNSAYIRFRNVHNYISENNFTGDGENNLVILDYDTPTEINKDNFFGHFIFGIESKHVQHVISNGKLIIKDKQILTVDENEILINSRKLSKELWKKMSD